MIRQEKGYPAMTRRGWMTAGLSAAVLALAGCSSTPVQRDTFYRLENPTLSTTRAGGPIRGVVDVPPLRASGLTNERAILYRDGPRQLAQYSYHAWLEPPALMLQHGLIRVLRQAQAFDTVTSPELRVDRDYELLGNIRSWEHVRMGSQGTAAIEIDISLRRVRGNQQILQKTYKANEAVAGDGVDGAVVGFTRGMDSIYAALLADLAALPQEASVSGGR